MLTASDLHTDQVLIRKIKRLQTAAQAADVDDDLEDSVVSRHRVNTRGTQRQRGEEVEVGSDDEEFNSRRSLASRIKSERAVSRSFTVGADEEEDDQDEQRTRPLPSPAGMIADVGEETEEEEDEDEEENEEV